MTLMGICSLTMIIALSLAQSDWYPCSNCSCQDFIDFKSVKCHEALIKMKCSFMTIECTKSEKEKTNYSFLWENIVTKEIDEILIKNCSLPVGTPFDRIGIATQHGGIMSITIEDYNHIHGWSALTKDHFKNLTQLRVLDLKGNTNLKLTDDFFEGNLKLEYLALDIKQVSLSADVFRPLGKLRYLSMITKHKFIVPDGIVDHNSNLVWLILRQEHVTLTDETDKTLSEWPTGLGELNISGISPILGKLTRKHLNNQHQLRILEMSQSNITEIEDGAFAETPRICALSLRGNQLSTIKSSVFSDLSLLEILDLRENRISHFEIYKNTLRSVNYINLNHNRLKDSNFLRSHLASLEKLDINNNLLESLYIKSMKNLDASYNRLNEKSFLNVTENVRIKILNISHNSIEQINIFASVSLISSDEIKLELANLDFSFNNLSAVGVDDMKFLSEVAKFTDLRHNPITTIHPIDMVKLESVDKHCVVNVEDVPFDCTCSIYELGLYLKRDVKPINIIIGNSTCSSPSFMKGKLLKDLQKCDVLCDDICPESCQCYRRPCDNAIVATCSLETMLLFSPEIRKLELTIQDSTFDPSLIDEEAFQKVSKLVIANNNILRLAVQDIPDNLQLLDLRNNSISHVGQDVVNKLKGSTSLKTIYISGNKIVCECENRPLLTFIQNKLSIFKDVHDEKCYNENELIRLVSIADLCGYGMVYTILGVLFAIVIIIILTCIALYYKYQTEVKVWLFAKGCFVSWITEEEIDKDKVYDAFLSWSHKDDEFVLNEILSKLEEGPTPFKICVHYRDWEVGEMINTQINRSIKQSRRTLVVLTPNFLKSAWGMYEFKQAHCHALEESRVRVIVICHGDLGPRDKLDPDLQAYLATRTYIEWGDARFWEKLMYALPHPTGKADLDGTFYYRSGMVHFRRRA